MIDYWQRGRESENSDDPASVCLIGFHHRHRHRHHRRHRRHRRLRRRTSQLCHHLYNSYHRSNRCHHSYHRLYLTRNHSTSCSKTAFPHRYHNHAYHPIPITVANRNAYVVALPINTVRTNAVNDVVHYYRRIVWYRLTVSNSYSVRKAT